MAVVVSIARGHDASYPFKTIGAAEGPTITGERGAGYYLSAVEKGGEPAGKVIGWPAGIVSPAAESLILMQAASDSRERSHQGPSTRSGRDLRP